MTAPLLDTAIALPHTGLHFIEASAGTGKTYTLATLAARWIAQTEIPTSQLLVVTFTRDAAAELRSRVRNRLTDLDRSLSSDDQPTNDDLAAYLRQSPDCRLHRARIATAIRDFDQATITTIHSFCQQLLARSGLEGNPRFRLRSDVASIEADVLMNSLTARSFAIDDAGVLPTANLLVNGLAQARNHPDTPLAPGDREFNERRAALDRVMEILDSHGGQPQDLNSAEALEALDLWQQHGSAETLMSNRTKVDPRTKVVNAMTELRKAAITAQVIASSRDTLEHRLADQGELGFADLLLQARSLITGSTATQAELSARWSVVFIDEFQDTDPTQWDIIASMLEASNPSRPTAVVVGDPKQAIYRFRGGDINTYQRAKNTPDSTLTTLDVNWRSSPELIAATNTLLADTTYGPGVTYGSIRAPKTPLDIERCVPDGAPIQARLIAQGSADDRKRSVAHDLAIEIRNLVADSALGYRDVAVLYKAHADAPALLRSLRDVGIPATIGRGESVLDSPAVRLWLTLLTAIERPTDARRVRAAALSAMFGHTAEQLLDPENVRKLQGRLQTLAATLEHHGVAWLTSVLMRSDNMAIHLMGAPDGERLLVDTEHIAELLHLATDGAATTATTLIATLGELVVSDPDDVDYAADLMKRRLTTDTDEDVVRLMSMHAAKGLEFEVVYLPTLWTATIPTAPHHYIDDDSRPVLRFGKKMLDEAAYVLAARETLDENCRLAYVALTRARQRVVLWWPEQPANAKPPKPNEFKNGFERLMAERAHALGLADPHPERVLQRIAELHPESLQVTIAAAAADLGSIEKSAPQVDLVTDMRAAQLDRELDRSASRLSFSRISGVAFPYDDRAHIATDPQLGDDAGSLDENPDEILDPVVVPSTNEVPLAVLPAGKQAGTRLHTIFEHIDFGQPQPVLADQVEREFSNELEPDDLLRVQRGIAAALQTPLGAAIDQVRLADIHYDDRLDEMQFDLALRGAASSPATLPLLSDIIVAHLDPDDADDDVIRAWALGLRDPARTVRFAGFLTGSIDLLFRVPTSDGDLKYVVADYKSNKVARWPEQMTPEVYQRERLGHEMVHGQYLLQALLYLVAANRFLKQRVENYDADKQLGPALYLFVRGMTGAQGSDGAPFGVFSWRPATAMIEAVDTALLAPVTS